MNVQKKFLPTLMLGAAITLFSACSKGSDGGGGASGTYPRRVNIEYRASSPSGFSHCNIIYTNETGGRTSLDSVALPYSVRFSRTVNRADLTGILASKNAGGSLKADILIDGVVVKTATVSAPSLYVSNSIAYALP